MLALERTQRMSPRAAYRARALRRGGRGQIPPPRAPSESCHAGVPETMTETPAHDEDAREKTEEPALAAEAAPPADTAPATAEQEATRAPEAAAEEPAAEGG